MHSFFTFTVHTINNPCDPADRFVSLAYLPIDHTVGGYAEFVSQPYYNVGKHALRQQASFFHDCCLTYYICSAETCSGHACRGGGVPRAGSESLYRSPLPHAHHTRTDTAHHERGFGESCVMNSSLLLASVTHNLRVSCHSSWAELRPHTGAAGTPVGCEGLCHCSDCRGALLSEGALC